MAGQSCDCPTFAGLEGMPPNPYFFALWYFVYLEEMFLLTIACTNDMLSLISTSKDLFLNSNSCYLSTIFCSCMDIFSHTGMKARQSLRDGLFFLSQ